MEDLLDTQTLAKRWRTTAGTLAKWRMKGYGPPFTKPGKYVFYELSEVMKWEREKKRRNTGKKR